MIRKYKIIGLTSGGLQGFSGANENILKNISINHELIGVIDNKLSGFWKYYNLLYCFLKLPGFSKYIHPFKEIYDGDVCYYRFRTKYYILKRTQEANKKLKNQKSNCDLIIQTGWLPAILEKNNIPRIIYTDFTMKLSVKEYPLWSRFLSNNDKKKWLEMETKTYQNANIIFSFSNHTSQSLIEDYGVSKDKVVTVYGGVDLINIPDIEKKYNSNIILFVGIDFERKGGYILLEAFKKVKNQIKNACLIIIGSNPKINIDGVEVKGFVSNEEKMQYYNKASVFAMPSIMEPFGLVFLEAMAYKLPCIGTNMDAIPEIIVDGETGFLVELNNSDIIGEKLIVLLKDKNLMAKMGEAGRKRVEKLFTWDKVVTRMSKEFDRLLKQNLS